MRVAADARAAQVALREGRRRLGPGLSFPGFHPTLVWPAADARDREPVIALGPAE
jgi:hypothetical protein